MMKEDDKKKKRRGWGGSQVNASKVSLENNMQCNVWKLKPDSRHSAA